MSTDRIDRIGTTNLLTQMLLEDALDVDLEDNGTMVYYGFYKGIRTIVKEEEVKLQVDQVSLSLTDAQKELVKMLHKFALHTVSGSIRVTDATIDTPESR